MLRWHQLDELWANVKNNAEGWYIYLIGNTVPDTTVTPEELYQFIHSLTPKTKQPDSIRKKILSYGGAFKEMSSSDYSDFVSHTRKTRTNLFDRKISL